MLVKELLPGGLPIAFRCRFQAGLLQNVGDCAVPDFMEQVSQSSLNSPVAPIPVLSGQTDHKPLDLVPGVRTAWAALLAAIIFPGDQLAVSSQQRGRSHNRGQVIKHTPAQFLGPDCQASALVVAKPQSLTSELLAEHTILFLKVVDDILLSLVYPARETNQEEPKGIECQTHHAIVAPEALQKGRKSGLGSACNLF